MSSLQQQLMQTADYVRRMVLSVLCKFGALHVSGQAKWVLARKSCLLSAVQLGSSPKTTVGRVSIAACGSSSMVAGVPKVQSRLDMFCGSSSILLTAATSLISSDLLLQNAASVPSAHPLDADRAQQGLATISRGSHLPSCV